MPLKKSKFREPKNTSDALNRLRKEIKGISRSNGPVDITESTRLIRWISGHVNMLESEVERLSKEYAVKTTQYEEMNPTVAQDVDSNNPTE